MGRLKRGKGAAGRGPDAAGAPAGRKVRERGYILLDVLVGLCIIAIGFAVFLGSLSIAGRITSKRGAALAALIEERSTHARERAVVFQKN